MTPTMRLRWLDTTVDKPFGVQGLVLREPARVLQQFWHISETESDITLPKVRGPDGEFGRWIDLPLEVSSQYCSNPKENSNG